MGLLSLLGIILSDTLSNILNCDLCAYFFRNTISYILKVSLC